MDTITLKIKVLSGDMQTVQLEPSSTIGKLKQKIAPLFKVVPSQLKLSITNGQIVQLDDNQKTVSDYSLSSESVVGVLIMPFQVFVVNEVNKTKTYDITADETVDQLLTKVSRKEQKPMDQLRLLYSSKQLECGKKLKDYGIVPGSTIHMTLRLRGG